MQDHHQVKFQLIEKDESHEKKQKVWDLLSEVYKRKIKKKTINQPP